MSTNQKPARNSCWCRRTISRKRRRTRLRATAFPRRREVINPARDGREFSAGATQSVSSLPRRVKPSRFTRSYSDACVRRRAFGNENEPVICISPDCTAGSLLPRSPRNLRTRRGLSRRFSRRLNCSGRFRCRSRTCFSRRCGRSGGGWSCRRSGGFGLLLTRREERGTGQDADVFFHSASSKGHIAVIESLEQDSF